MTPTNSDTQTTSAEAASGSLDGAHGSGLLIPSDYDPADMIEELDEIREWPSGVRCQEQKNKWCHLYTIMHCPTCGDTEEALCTDGDAYECRVCGAVHPFPNIRSQTCAEDKL